VLNQSWSLYFSYCWCMWSYTYIWGLTSRFVETTERFSFARRNNNDGNRGFIVFQTTRIS